MKTSYLLNLGPKEKILMECACEIVTPLIIRTGKIVVTNYQLRFFDHLSTLEGLTQSTGPSQMEPPVWKENIEFFEFKKKPHKKFS
jgi:hypothetical protein